MAKRSPLPRPQGSPPQGSPPQASAPQTSPSWTAVDDANRLLRAVSEAFDWAAKSEGWPSRFSPIRFTPIRFLVLAHLHHATVFGLTPKRLAWLLCLPPSSLAHHLNVLEDAGMVDRRPRDLHDGRAVSVRLTPPGSAAYHRLEEVLAAREKKTLPAHPSRQGPSGPG